MFEAVRALNSAIDAGQIGQGRRGRDPRGIRAVRRRARRVEPAPGRGRTAAGAGRRDRATDRGASRRPAPSRFRRRRSDSRRSGGTRRAARRQFRRHALETKITIKTSSARAQGRGADRPRPGGRLAVVHPRLSAGHRARPWIARPGRGRQRVSRLRGRHRGQFHRALASRRRPRDRRSGAEVPPHVGDRLLLRAAGAARRRTGIDRAGRQSAGGWRSFFGNSGTEAIEACLKLARYATGRQNIIAFLGGFHGRSMGSLALTASKAIQRRGFGPLLPGVYHAPYPDRYRCPLGIDAGDLSPRRASITSSTRSSRISSRRTKSPRSSSNRFRAKAGTSSRPTDSCRGCAR